MDDEKPREMRKWPRVTEPLPEGVTNVLRNPEVYDELAKFILESEARHRKEREDQGRGTSK